MRKDHKKKQVLVKWKGYHDDFNTWIPLKDLQIIHGNVICISILSQVKISIHINENNTVKPPESDQVVA